MNKTQEHLRNFFSRFIPCLKCWHTFFHNSPFKEYVCPKCGFTWWYPNSNDLGNPRDLENMRYHPVWKLPPSPSYEVPQGTLAIFKDQLL